MSKSKTRRGRTRQPWRQSMFRFYCPKCGEVRGNERYGFPKEHDGVSKVYGHTRTGGIMCPGGYVDPKEDRAP